MEGMGIMADLLKEFGDTIGVSDMAPDEDGYVSFSVDDDLIIHLQYEQESEGLRFFASLGEVSPVDRASVIADMLDANVLWRGTGGATLGLDSEKDVVTMAYQEPIGNMSYGRFEQLLDGFLITAEQWTRRIQGDAGAADKEPAVGDMQGSIRV